MDQRCFKAKGLILLLAVSILGACATTPHMLTDRWDKLEKASFAVGYALGRVLYAQSGNLGSIDQEIVNIGDRASEAVEKLPSWESKSYLLVEARAKIDGLNAFRNDIEKGDNQ